VSLTLSAAAPAGGAVVTLSSSNPAAARVPASVTVPAGQGFAAFNVTTFSVAADTAVTITGTYGVSQTATITVLAAPGGGTAPAVDVALSGVPATVRRGQTFTATATVTNSGTAAASGYSVVLSVSPSDAVRLQTSATQSVATIAAPGSRTVSWQIRGDKAEGATVTIKLRDASGATIRTVSRTFTVTN
jgi:CARDB